MIRQVCTNPMQHERKISQYGKLEEHPRKLKPLILHLYFIHDIHSIKHRDVLTPCIIPYRNVSCHSQIKCMLTTDFFSCQK
uniref:Uncharacterized protein n=1 Tax=Arundo donax TaxID=35708 RepID=A0A0A9DGS8_ARUDO